MFANHCWVQGYDRHRATIAAAAILSQGGWCVFEVCVDVPRQRWEVRPVIFDLGPEAVAATVAEEIAYEPELDARLTGCDRRTLQPVPAMGAYLCYVSGAAAPSARPGQLPPADVRTNAMNDATAGRSGPTALCSKNQGLDGGPSLSAISASQPD